MDGNQPQNDEPNWQFKPGETVSPRQTPTAETPQPIVPAQPEPAVAAPSASASPAPVNTSAPSPAPDPAPSPAIAAPQTTDPLPSTEPPASENDQMDGNYISWTASEFIAHEKSAGWHVILVLVAVVVAVLTWFITKDIITPVVIIVAGVILSFYGGRRPNQLQYQLGDQGLQVGNRYYDFNDFRSFAVVPEGAIASIALTPSKRFSPLVTLYFDPQDGDKIIDILGMHLPHRERKVDAIDGLMRRIRF
jgi:hypothetical protein